MLHPLKKQVRAVRRRAHRLVLVHGLGWWAAATLLVAFFVGLMDYLLRFQDDRVRVFAFVAVASFLLAAFWRLVWPGLRQRTTDLQVAQLIERRFPQLQDRLSSSLAFLGEPAGQSAMGSPALQNSVVTETDQLVATLNIFDCLEGYRAWRAMGVFLFVAATTCVVSALDLPAAKMASQRLLLPWSKVAWPRRNQLAFVDPPRQLARGSDFEVVLVDRNGNLPTTAKLQIKFAEDTEMQTRHIHRVDNQMVARLPNVTRAFTFRAVGGDDHTMAWHELKVREPIHITNVKVYVQPPEYTGLPSRNSNRLIRAWEGSSIRLEVDLGAMAESVRINSNFAEVPELELAPHGQRFHLPPAASAPWIPTKSGTFRFQIRDRGGLEVMSDLEFELTLVADLPPTVTVETPEENDSFLAGADVPVQLIVKDDLAVRSASLMFHDQTQLVFANPAADDRSKANTTPRVEGDRNVVHAVLQLDGLGLQPGEVFEFHAAAADGKPQTGISDVRRLTIITEEEFDNRLNLDQAELRRRIEKALVLQRHIKSQTDGFVDASNWSDRVPSAELLQAAQWGQQQIRQLVSGTDGALSIAGRLLQRLSTNHVDKPDVTARLNAVVTRLGELNSLTLPTIEHQLGNSLKISQTWGSDPTKEERSNSHQALRIAQQNQQQSVEILDGLLEQFSKWGNVRRVATDLAEMRQQQERLIQDTDDLDTVGKSRDALTDEEARRLAELVQRQAQLARQADRLLLDLEKLKQNVAAENPAFSEILRHAFDVAQDSEISAAAHAARRHLEGNQIGSAASQQRKVQAALDQILAAISQRTADPAGSLLARVQGWLARQQSISTETRQVLQAKGVPQTPARAQLTVDLAKRQVDLAGEIQVAAKPEPRLVVRQILDDARDLMTKAADSLERMDAGPLVTELQQAAHEKLLRVRDALRLEDRQASGSADSSGDPAGQPPSEDGPQPRISVADLQLLRQMQLEINQQTAEVEKSRDDTGSLGLEQQVKLTEIEGQQQRLVDLMSTLLGQQPAPTTTTPAKVGTDLDDALRKANIPGFSED